MIEIYEKNFSDEDDDDDGDLDDNLDWLIEAAEESDTKVNAAVKKILLLYNILTWSLK